MANLSMDNMVNVTVDLSPIATVRDSYNSGLIIGTSPVIPVSDRVREYRSTSQMLDDGFTTTMPEYLAAQLYFGAIKRPERLFVGICDTSETYLEAAAECRNVNYEWYGFTCLGAQSADILSLAGFAESVSPYSTYFYTTPFTQPEFDVSYTGDAGAFTETQTNGSISILFDTLPEEDPVASEFQVSYEGNFLSTTFNYDSVIGQVTLLFTPVEVDVDTEIFTQLQNAGYQRTHGMYSTQTDAVVAVMGYAMGANTQVNNSAFTLAYKPLPGVSTSDLTENEVTQIKSANGNVYVRRGGKYNVYEQGTQASGAYFDEIIGVDTLVGNIQASAMNLLVNATKIAYTDAGVTRIINAITPDFEQAVNVGFIAPGVWTAGDITVDNTVLLEDNTMLPKGYGIFAGKVGNVSQVTRESRVAPQIICPIKLSGAIEHIVITIPVNR